MVDAITPVSTAAAASPTQIGTSTAIDSAADLVWIAARQAQLMADQRALRRGAETEMTGDDAVRPLEDDTTDRDDGQSPKQRREARLDHLTADDEPQPDDAVLLSGESERIGTQNFDEDTPFGSRIAIL